MSVNLLIVDDHLIVREGLKQLLSLYSDFHILSEASNGNDLLEQLQVKPQQPDLITLDILMPGLSGTALIERLRDDYPHIPVLILSMHNETQIIRRALLAGAKGYLTKDCDAQTLVEAIRRIADGGRYLECEIAEKLAFEPAERLANEEKHQSLSKREFHVFCLLAKGLTVNDIAEQLHISNKTVSTHKFRLMQKMDLTSNSEIVRYALSHNLIQ
ncbi:response regulator transcription factor [Vibrio porteresiae]|uniref:Response regulator transcription factor n=1 Tax=Vibrio porteresiae DSM 19223 TaxID=1123496 RepID=A0ABZ0QAQ7_9VIBR|nr:response regulator transcription factor [Vibrio porteresiae]WPC73480.1 response regulator transcription factor [Vibrio porteresiae DSM 19223]